MAGEQLPLGRHSAPPWEELFSPDCPSRTLLNPISCRYNKISYTILLYFNSRFWKNTHDENGCVDTLYIRRWVRFELSFASLCAREYHPRILEYAIPAPRNREKTLALVLALSARRTKSEGNTNRMTGGCWLLPLYYGPKQLLAPKLARLLHLLKLIFGVYPVKWRILPAGNDKGREVFLPSRSQIFPFWSRCNFLRRPFQYLLPPAGRAGRWYRGDFVSQARALGIRVNASNWKFGQDEICWRCNFNS